MVSPPYGTRWRDWILLLSFRGTYVRRTQVGLVPVVSNGPCRIQPGDMVVSVIKKRERTCTYFYWIRCRQSVSRQRYGTNWYRFTYIWGYRSEPYVQRTVQYIGYPWRCASPIRYWRTMPARRALSLAQAGRRSRWFQKFQNASPRRNWNIDIELVRTVETNWWQGLRNLWYSPMFFYPHKMNVGLK
jgi:hypothetical protein